MLASVLPSVLVGLEKDTFAVKSSGGERTIGAYGDERVPSRCQVTVTRERFCTAPLRQTPHTPWFASAMSARFPLPELADAYRVGALGMGSETAWDGQRVARQSIHCQECRV